MQLKKPKPMNAQEAYNLLEPIPEEKFMRSFFTDGRSACCAAGHLIRLTSDNPKDYSLKNCVDIGHSPVITFIRDTTGYFLTEVKKVNGFVDLATVNNAKLNGYNEDTCKARVLHLLKDMIQWEKEKNNEETQEETHD